MNWEWVECNELEARPFSHLQIIIIILNGADYVGNGVRQKRGTELIWSMQLNEISNGDFEKIFCCHAQNARPTICLLTSEALKLKQY